MIWVKARFYEPSHRYVCATIGFREDDLVSGSVDFQMFAAGYKLATGRTATWDEVHTINPTSHGEYYIIPDHLDKLGTFLLKYKDDHEST